MYIFRIPFILLLILALSSPLTLLAESNKTAELYEDAVIRLNKDDIEGAIIQLKNVLKADANMLPARVLLGKSYLKNGQPINAESELLNANVLGADPALTLPSLAQAYYMQYKYQTLIKNININGLPADIQSELLIYIGNAHLKLGHIEQAAEAFKQAQEIHLTADAVAGTALVLIHQGKLAAAREMLIKAEQLDADQASVWSVKASISHLKGDLQQALNEYTKAIELDDKNLDAQLARVGILLDLDNREEAHKAINNIREEYKFEPRSIYLDAILLLREGKSKEALKATQEAAGILSEMNPTVINNNRTLLLLAGMVFYDLKQYEQAINYLDLFVKKYPQQVGARKILGSIYLEQREYEKALEVLKPALNFAPDDPRLLALLGNAYMYNDKPDLAVQLLEKAAVFSYQQADIRTDLALGYLNSGDSRQALTELENIYKQDNRQTATGMVLALVYYKLGQLDKARQLAEELSAKEPDNSVFLNWAGSIEAASGNYSRAGEYFKRAIKINPDFIIAQINQGKLLLAQGKAEQAKAHYQAILKQHPEHTATMMELARVYEAQGNFTKAISLMKQTLRLDREQVQTRLYLINLYSRDAQYKEAFQLAEETQELAPKNMDVLLTVVSTSLAAGQPDDARLAFKHMKDIALTNGEAFFRIARAELQAGFLKDAIKTMSLSLHYRPNYLPAQIILTESLLQDGQIQYASDLAKEIKTTHPELADAFRLTGDVLMHSGQPEAAEQEYQQAFQREVNTTNLLNLYQAMVSNRKPNEAALLLEQWLKTHPDDQQARYALVQSKFQQGDLVAAQQNLEIILRQSPDNAYLLNNLANIYALNQDPRALKTARKAYKLAPDNPAINDTLGWLLVQSGDPSQGLSYLREAHFRLGDSPEIRYHIAVALHQLDRDKEALKELKLLLKSGQDFNGIEDARELKKKLTAQIK